LFDMWKRVAFAGELSAELQVINPADKLGYFGRFCPCGVIAVDLTRPMISIL
jgi:hypothetical protein